MTDLKNNLNTIFEQIPDPNRGLPDEIFSFVSKVTPMINIDILIKNEQNQTLLTWRSDPLCGTGWHIPGRIIRYKETLDDCIHALAKEELNATVEIIKGPISLHQIMIPQQYRGHFISLLFECKLTSDLPESFRFDTTNPQSGHWSWHEGSPQNLLQFQHFYESYIRGDEKITELPAGASIYQVMPERTNS